MIESVLAQQLASILAPYLPFLMSSTISSGKDAAIKSLGGKFVDAAWNKAADIWGKLKPTVDKDPNTIKALRDVATKNQDARAENVLSWQLESLDLSAETLKELQKLVATADGGLHVNVATNRGIATQGVSTGNIFNTGDQK